MSRYEKKDSEKKFPIVMALIIVALIVMGILFFIETLEETDIEVVSESMEIPAEKLGAATDMENLLVSYENEDTAVTSEEAELAKFLADLSEETESLAIEKSDDSFKGAVAQVSENLAQWFGAKDVIHQYIFLINDISQNQILAKNRKFLQPPKKLEVQKDGQGLYLDEKSYQRYDDFAQTIDQINVNKGVGVYQAFKPLLNHVYKLFSYPDTYQLDDIFLKAAANVIKAPVVEDRISLVKHSLLYKFEDKKLEELSAVEKQMLRMGPKNTKIIQAKLRFLVEAILAEKE